MTYIMCTYLYKVAARWTAFSCSWVKCIHMHACTCMCVKTYICTLFFSLPCHASQLLTRPAGKFRTCSPELLFFDTGCKRVCKVWGWYWDPHAAASVQGCPPDTGHEMCGGAELCTSGGVFCRNNIFCCSYVSFREESLAHAVLTLRV